MAGPATDSKAYMIEYFYAVVIGGMLGMLVGMVIARELGECIYHDDPSSGADDVSTFHAGDHAGDDGSDAYYEYTQAGKAWVWGSTGVGVFIGILSMMLYRNSAANKSTFTSFFGFNTSQSQPVPSPNLSNFYNKL